MNDLLQKNAIDLIQLGFEDYFLINQDKRRVLTAIRNIYAGILLLLKAELKIRSPKNFGDTLIKKQHAFAIINENIVVKSKGVKTIGLDDMENRYRLLNLSIKDHLNELVELSKIRNEIEHHFTQFPKETLETSILMRIIAHREHRLSRNVNSDCRLIVNTNYRLNVNTIS
ncbi:hypothetical protein [Legionella sp. W05-934-2]|uniref:hypothetical protein n=1 Tax=Legionella sp. W05-934-2 TaxID=1198649 RepID=UPI003461CA9E